VSSAPATATAAAPLILVVEDDGDLRTSLVQLLRLEGYEVEGAEHGEEALQRFRGGLRPRLVLLDMMMPVMNGLDLLRHLEWEGLRDGVPVVALSALTQLPVELPVQGHLRKPPRLQELLALARRHCA
jgi:CheY-like chemotaxis protein